MKKLKRERREVLLERHTREAVPVLRRLLRQVGVWTVIGLIREITFQQRERLLREQPDALIQLDLEYAMALELATALELENTANWPRRPKKK